MLAHQFVDDRVGYFTDAYKDMSRDGKPDYWVRYVNRWKLEKKDPTAALSEPVKPIVYYIDAATPTKWVPWLKKGIEDWNEAFEAAGFKNAIIGKEAPTGPLMFQGDHGPVSFRNIKITTK